MSEQFSFSNADLDCRAIRTSQSHERRMFMYGQRGMSGVVAHGIPESLGTLSGYICKLSPHAAEGINTVSVKARSGFKR